MTRLSIADLHNAASVPIIVWVLWGIVLKKMEIG